MGFSLGKVFKPVKKLGQKLWDINRKGIEFGAPIVGQIIGGDVGGRVGSYIGQSVASGDSPERNAQKRADFEYARSLADQRAFQDDSIQRRVADARAAGIHPLAALGFQSPGFIPPQTSEYPTGGDYGMSEMGQDIGRAVYASQTQKERASSATTQAQLNDLVLQRARLENKGLELDNLYKLSRFVRMREGTGPAFPDVNAVRNVGVRELGQGDALKHDPMTQRWLAPDGSVVTTMTEGYNEATEGDPVGRTSGLYNTYYKPWRDQILAGAERWKRDLYGYYGRRDQKRQLQPIRPTGVRKRMYSSNSTPFF